LPSADRSRRREEVFVVNAEPHEESLLVTKLPRARLPAVSSDQEQYAIGGHGGVGVPVGDCQFDSCRVQNFAVRFGVTSDVLTRREVTSAIAPQRCRPSARRAWVRHCSSVATSKYSPIKSARSYGNERQRCCGRGSPQGLGRKDRPSHAGSTGVPSKERTIRRRDRSSRSFHGSGLAGTANTIDDRQVRFTHREGANVVDGSRSTKRRQGRDYRIDRARSRTA